MSENLIEQLRALPDGWAFLPCGPDKRPYGEFAGDWSNKPQKKKTVEREIIEGRCVSVGVMSGPKSGGLLMVDHDGQGASEELKLLGLQKGLGDLPKSWACTSSKNARLQIIYRVPEKYWDRIKTTKLWKARISSFNEFKGKEEQEKLELRWDGCQSILLGYHPETKGYRWLKGRAPNDLPIADAPDILLRQMLKPQQRETNKAPYVTKTDSERARSYLRALSAGRSDDYDEWLKVGMALHSTGDDSLLFDWDSWSSQSAKYEQGICDAKWNSFEAGGSVTLGTLHEYAKQDGWIPDLPTRQYKNTTNQEQQTRPDNDSGAIQLRKLEAIELLTILRQQRVSDNIRFNVFTQEIEINEKPIEGIDRFYLTLAQMGYKVPKELAIDCLVEVARENEYDPVKNYLEFVSETVKPTYVDALSTTYLRPEDEAGCLYDEMLKKSLIGAVKRIYEPGCKHDTSCILIGCQGARKSTFWNVLGGPFFSDSLKDIGSKDDLMVLHRSFIMEMSELDHITTKKQAGLIKAFLSQSTDIYRVPYGKSTEVFPRRGIIVGSTNRNNFLMDETGNRRFWCIPVTKNITDPIDTPNLIIERDAIWSGIVKAYKEGETNYLDATGEIKVDDENQDYLVASPWQKAIEEFIDNKPFETLTTELLLRAAIEKPLDRQTKADQMQVADVLKRLGYDKKRITVNGRRQWEWYKV
tara:strand:+ start:3621 stop:5711 length:2091 start_codon:yes stop_codon:yes gene_type:complete